MSAGERDDSIIRYLSLSVTRHSRFVEQKVKSCARGHRQAVANGDGWSQVASQLAIRQPSILSITCSGLKGAVAAPLVDGAPARGAPLAGSRSPESPQQSRRISSAVGTHRSSSFPFPVVFHAPHHKPFASIAASLLWLACDKPAMALGCLPAQRPANSPPEGFTQHVVVQRRDHRIRFAAGGMVSVDYGLRHKYNRIAK